MHKIESSGPYFPEMPSGQEGQKLEQPGRSWLGRGISAFAGGVKTALNVGAKVGIAAAKGGLDIAGKAVSLGASGVSLAGKATADVAQAALNTAHKAAEVAGGVFEATGITDLAAGVAAGVIEMAADSADIAVELLSSVKDITLDTAGNVGTTVLTKTAHMVSVVAEKGFAAAALAVDAAKPLAEKAAIGAITVVSAVGEATFVTAITALEVAEVGAQALEGMRQAAVSKKDALVKSYAEGFTPKKIFGNQSFKQMVENLVKSSLPQFRNTGAKVAEVYREHLAESLGRIGNKQNLARLGAAVMNELGKVVKEVRQQGSIASEESMIQALGYGKLPVKEFKEEMDKEISKNIATLSSRSKESVVKFDSATAAVSVSIWGMIKTAIHNLIRAIQKKVVKQIVKKYVTPTWVAGQVGMQSLLENQVAARLGVEQAFKVSVGISEVIVLHLFNQITKEMKDISVEAYANEEQGKEANVSGFDDAQSANTAFREAFGKLGTEMKSFKPQEGNLVFSVVETIGDFVMPKQGTGDSIFDVATPAFDLLYPAWKNWLSE